MTIGVIATLTIAEGKNEEFEGIFSELVRQVNDKEAGCNFYQIHRSRKDPQVYVVLEQYADQESFDAHGKTEYFRELGKQMGACMALRSWSGTFRSHTTCAFSTMAASGSRLLSRTSTSSPAFAAALVCTNRPVLDTSSTNPENVL